MEPATLQLQPPAGRVDGGPGAGRAWYYRGMANLVTGAQVLELTGQTVTDAQITQAQGIVELVTGYDLSTVDWATRVTFAKDQRKLRSAIAYQSAFIAVHPDVFTAQDVTSQAADGQSVAYGTGGPVLAPLAKMALRKLSKGRSQSVRVKGLETDNRLYNGVVNVPEWTDELDRWVPLS